MCNDYQILKSIADQNCKRSLPTCIASIIEYQSTQQFDDSSRTQQAIDCEERPLHCDQRLAFKVTWKKLSWVNSINFSQPWIRKHVSPKILSRPRCLTISWLSFVWLMAQGIWENQLRDLTLRRPLGEYKTNFNNNSDPLSLIRHSLKKVFSD